MEVNKVLKPGCVIKGIDFSYGFYEKLSAMFMNLAFLDPEEIDSQKEMLETMAILMATLDEAAEAQGLVEISESEE